MREMLLMRHAMTAWNLQRRIQGRRDVALEPGAREELARRRVPSPWRDGEWHVSPLQRAVESARALGARTMLLEPRLQEMDWGEWEGCTLTALRARHGEAMRRNESRGLDFRPSGGESPREVRARLAGWIEGLNDEGPPVLVMTHKGVIRAALSLAAGWDMKTAFPQRLDWACGVALVRGSGGALRLEKVNVPLEPVP